MERVDVRGRGVQVDRIKPVLKAPESMLSKRRCDGSLSNVGFNFNLRRCGAGAAQSGHLDVLQWCGGDPWLTPD